MLKNINNYLNESPKYKVFLASLVFVFMLGLADFYTGSEISFSVFYLLPICVAVWYGGFSAGLSISVIASCVWYFADVITGNVYSHISIPIWNALVRFGFFGVTVYLLNKINYLYSFEKNLANTDTLTGLKNARYFFEQLEQEILRSKRNKRPFTLAYFDLDNFKDVNDSRGHDIGDKLIEKIAKLFLDNIRQIDVAARLGGDEFAILLHETDYDNANIVFLRIQDKFRNAEIEKEYFVTFSLGAVTYSEHYLSAKESIKDPEMLMYKVKKKGKNDILHEKA